MLSSFIIFSVSVEFENCRGVISSTEICRGALNATARYSIYATSVESCCRMKGFKNRKYLYIYTFLLNLLNVGILYKTDLVPNVNNKKN